MAAAQSAALAAVAALAATGVTLYAAGTAGTPATIRAAPLSAAARVTPCVLYRSELAYAALR